MIGQMRLSQLTTVEYEVYHQLKIYLLDNEPEYGMAKQIAGALDKMPTNVSAALKRLVSYGMVRKVRQGVYEIV